MLQITFTYMTSNDFRLFLTYLPNTYHVCQFLPDNVRFWEAFLNPSTLEIGSGGARTTIISWICSNLGIS